MSVTCDHCRGHMLDFLYGLLDPAEEAAVAAHVAGCPTCTAARAEASGMKGLFATAAKAPFPEVKFAIPADATPPPPPRKPSRTLSWAIAASMVLGSLGLLSPLVRDYAAYREQSLASASAAGEMRKLEDADKERREKQAQLVQKLEEKRTELLAPYKQTLRTWVSSDMRERAQPYRLSVTGPVAAIPGAMNEYTFSVIPSQEIKYTVAVTVTVRDSRGTVFHTQTLPSGETKWRLPTDLWTKFPAGAEDIVLAVSAVNDAGTKAELTEPIQLLAPVFTTLVVTDKPLYRPGESVYFRSLTLNRTTLQPPGRDLTIRFELRKPDGTRLENGVLTGTTQAVLKRDGIEKPVVGPDGSPVRGIACGAFALPAAVPGGEYTLLAFELPQGWDNPELPKGVSPIGTRKITVAKYQPEALQKTLEFDAKTYGPGDTVQAKLTVKNQDKPVKNAIVLVTATHGKNQKIPVKAVSLDANGSATITFKLPADADLNNVVLTASVQDQHAESIVRPVPIASKTLSLEFFPEGGDLIEGLPNRVYVRATSTTGRPADVEGSITDGARTICDVKTLTDPEHPGVNQGLGVFTFTPEAGKRYALKLHRPVGTVEPEIKVPQLASLGRGYLLPKADADGVVLSVPHGVIDANRPLTATITAAKSKRTLLVGVYTRGLVIGHQRLTAEPGKPVTVTITPPPIAIGGVTRVTVFEEPAANAGRMDLVPLAERLVFRRPTEKLNLSFATDRKGPYSPGDKVTLTVKATNEKDQPTAAVLLAAVVNQSVLTMADDTAERRLPTHFLLAGELQHPEQLENADFILTDHPKAAETLDLLLGTQGWRRFAEANGQFRSTAVSDAEKLEFFIAAGRHDPLGEAKPESVTAKNRAALDPIEAKLDQLEAEKREAERERDRKPAGWQERATAQAEAREKALDAWAQTQAKVLPVALALTALFLGAACLWLAYRKKVRGITAALILSVPLLGLGVYVLKNGLWIGAEAPRFDFVNARVGAANAAGLPPRADGDLRDAVRVNPPPVPRVALAEPPPRPDIGRGNARPAAGEAPVTKLQSHRADRAHLTLREGGPTRDEEAAISRVKAALTRHSSFVVREYAHLPRKADPHDPTRTDFTETVLWHPVLVLPGEGQMTLDFHVSDAINAYRVLIAGHTLDGRLGSATGLLEVQKPLAVGVKLPPEISFADRPHLPLVVANGTARPLDAKVGYWSDFLVADENDHHAAVPASAGARVLTPVKPTGLGASRVRVSVAGDGHTDAIERTLNIMPDGFPVSGVSNTELKGTAKTILTSPANVIPGTLKVQVQVFTNSFADIAAGLDGMIREPNGCFEQTSSANYPNVLALQYLKDSNQTGGRVADRALGLLERGYGKLTKFESPKAAGPDREGFEWFGGFPAHESLTAYGLVQFLDMATVFPVDPQLLERTRNYLLSRRDGRGGYTRRKTGVDSFGGAVPDAVANAYLTWAISVADPKADLAREAKAVATEALQSGDPYRLALAARVTPTPELLAALASTQKPDGSLPGAETSITRSAGADLVVETTAVAALAWVHAKSPDSAVHLGRAIGFLVKARQPGGAFGGTQATVLALKAIVAFNQTSRRTAESGDILIRVDGKEAGRVSFKSDDLKPAILTFENAEKLFPPGDHEITLETTATQSYPVSVMSAASSRKPDSAVDTPVKLTATLSDREVIEGHSVRLAVQLQNMGAKDTGMAVAIIGLPAGLKLPPDVKQFKGLTAKPQKGEAAVSHWEQNGRELILYWRGLAPKQLIDLSLDLIADIPGEYHGPASRAYLYYNATAKHWLDPLAVVIRPAR